MKVQWIAKRTSATLVKQVCPERQQDTHKGDYGRILLLCGAEGYTGAPYLAAQAALRSGAGLIYTAVPRAIYPIVAEKLHEPIVLPLQDHDGKFCRDALDDVLGRLEQMDACLLGPGLGRSSEINLFVEELIRHCKCPLVLDADGINAVSEHIGVLREAACPVILTPHEGEFRRLRASFGGDRVEEAMALAEQTQTIILRKGHISVITNGVQVYLNRTGNAGMATGGSGDVLAGILVSLLGQGAPPLEATAAAAWLHGTAGDLAEKQYGQYAMVPSDIIEQLSRLLP